MSCFDHKIMSAKHGFGLLTDNQQSYFQESQTTYRFMVGHKPNTTICNMYFRTDQPISAGQVVV